MGKKHDSPQIVNITNIININSNNISKNNKVLESRNPSTLKNKRWNSIKTIFFSKEILQLLTTLILNILIRLI